jgi:hypothetical protein
MLRLTSKSLATYKRRAPGAVAQMGERCNRTAEVRGSIPLGSTNSSIWPDAASVTAHSGGQIGPLHAASAPLAADAGEWPPGACAGAHHAQRLPGIFSAQAFIAGFAAAPRCMRDRGEIGARSERDRSEIRGRDPGQDQGQDPGQDPGNGAPDPDLAATRFSLPSAHGHLAHGHVARLEVDAARSRLVAFAMWSPRCASSRDVARCRTGHRT